MSEEKEKTIPTWGYKGSESKVFQLVDGEALPDGWTDSPEPAPEPKKRGRPKKEAIQESGDE